ncbi:hypothetical protein [Methylobacter sp.]|uniref:hypothetical protein n=1 Tax=Methylobacter sp. TaxID=2051955 RepID=UPI002FDED1C9
MTTPTQIFIDCDAKDFSEAFCDSLLDVQQLIAEEIRSLVGNDESETERIKPIFEDVFGKAVSKQEKSGGDFSHYHSKELQKAFSKGITLKEFQLSRLIHISGLAAGHFSNSNLKGAFNCLSMANRFLGEYRNNNELYEYFNTPFKKKEQENFRLDTLLKLIFGMANHGYKCKHYNIESSAICISTRLQKLKIQVDNKDIIKYLHESVELEPQWKERRENQGIVTETERSTMLKLIIGMAIDKYDYDPNSDTNKATGSGDYGISAKIPCHCYVHDNSIRNCLKAAKKIILPSQEQ